MNDYPSNIGPGGEILDPMGVQTTQPQGMGVQTINHGQAAAEAAAQTLVKARFQMALMRPRNVFQARSKILEACRRPGFAESAIYRKPVGKKKNESTGTWEQQYVEGPSIRFAEEALRSLGNVDVRQQMVFEDDEKRVVCVTVMDLENNVAWPTEIPISKRVERSSVKEGQKVFGQRMNSYNKPVYLVEASEDEITTKQQAAVSKALRTAALRIVPGDILEEALQQIKETLTKKDQTDPKAALKKVLDAFQSLGITPAELEKFLDHPLESITPAEIGNLRGIYQSVKDGDSTWKSVLDGAKEEREAAAKDKKKGAAEPPPVDGATPPPEAPQTPAQQARARASAAGKTSANQTLPLE